MDRFLVVACVRCGRTKGVESDQKTFKCPTCGHNNAIAQLKVYGQTDDPAHLPALIATVQTTRDGGEEEYYASVEEVRQKQEAKLASSDDLDLREVRTVVNKKERLEQGVQLLGADGNTFSEEELVELMLKLDLKDYAQEVDRWIGYLMVKDIIYEPKAGLYGLV